MEEKIRYIEQEIKNTGLAVTLAQAEQFYRYYEILLEWNAFMNLTAITDFPDVVKKHFVDSLLIIQVKNMEDVDNLIDLGTGAGFPGVPLKIMFPHLRVTLLDALKKRIDFLNELTIKLGLAHVETIHGRAEDYAKPGKKREQYDLCVSRAVANLSTLSEYCLPYVKIGGEFISYKSREAEQEIEEAKSAIFQEERSENVRTLNFRALIRSGPWYVYKKLADVRRNIPENQVLPRSIRFRLDFIHCTNIIECILKLHRELPVVEALLYRE